jgi:hypothetical protein
MDTGSLALFRLVIAALNGALFAFGLALLLELVWLRPRRWRRELTELLPGAEREEIDAWEPERDGDDAPVSGKRERIQQLKELLANHFKEPKTRLNIGFAVLIIVVALASLLGLLVPSWGLYA